jgi:transcriptional regulator with XRE-family HTH domain
MKKELKKEIGQRMRQIRKALGYTQEQMVSYFEIGRANYSRIEKGEVHPGATILNTLRTRFNVSLDWLITNNGKMFLRDRDKKNDRVKIDFGQSTEEVLELLSYMGKVPMVKHAILSYFLEYKLKNRKIIREVMDEYETPAENGAASLNANN